MPFYCLYYYRQAHKFRYALLSWHTQKFAPYKTFVSQFLHSLIVTLLRFFSTFDMNKLGKIRQHHYKSALKLVNLPNLKGIRLKRAKMWLRKVAKIYRRLYRAEQVGWQVCASHHTNVCKFSRLWGAILCFHSRSQHLCKFIGTKESFYMRKEFNSHRTGLGHKHGRRVKIWLLWRHVKTHNSLRTADVFPVVASLPPKSFGRVKLGPKKPNALAG